MLFLQGELYGKEYVKKGISLIEIVITMGLIGILLAAQVAILSKIYLQYNKHLNYSIENMYVNEAFRILENEIYKEWRDIDVSNDCITIKLNNGDKSKIHFVKTKKNNSKGNLVITYYLNNNVKTSNYLTKNIKDFKAYCKGNILYLTIYGDDEREYNKCLAIEKGP